MTAESITILPMVGRSGTGPVAKLWQLGWNDARIACTVHHSADGFEIRLESPTAVILTESFMLEPRMLARTDALRAALIRRGWRDLKDS